MNDRQGPRATASYTRNWLILLAVVLLVGLASFVLQFLGGSAVAALTVEVTVGAIAGFAIVDGGWRLLGNEGFLGPGEGFDRYLAFIQVLFALDVLVRLFE